MKIEILTRDTEKKTDIMTWMRGAPGFRAAGGMAGAAGVKAEFTPGYILLTATVPWMADELIRLLFNIRPVPYATGFFEVEGDIRAIVTCAARPLSQIIPALIELDHLDLEAGELAGRYESRWLSRDVSVSANYEVIVQGGVAVARIKFASHFRESHQQCRSVIGLTGLAEGLPAFAPKTG